jgi:hypothetical protein
LAKTADGSDTLNTHLLAFLADVGTMAVEQAGYKNDGWKTAGTGATVVRCSKGGMKYHLHMWLDDDIKGYGGRGQGSIGTYTVWFSMGSFIDPDETFGNGTVNATGNMPGTTLARLIAKQLT